MSFTSSEFRADHEELFHIWEVKVSDDRATLLWADTGGTVITFLPSDHARELQHIAERHNAIIAMIHDDLKKTKP